MSCCGKKRNAWIHKLSNQGSQAKRPVQLTEAKKTDEANPLMEYTGNASLTLKGVATGNIYHFTSRGERIKIDYLDSLAFMAEYDLIKVKAVENVDI